MYGVVVVALFYFNARVLVSHIYLQGLSGEDRSGGNCNLWHLRGIWRKKVATIALYGFFPGSPPGPTHTRPFPSLSNCTSHDLPITNENPYSCCFAQHIIPPYLECQLLDLFFFFLLKEVVLTGGKPRSFVVK